MVQVGAYPTRSDAELAQTALAAAGIRSMVAADDAGGAYPFRLTGGARLLVDEADAEAAPLARYLFWELVALIVFGIVLVFVEIPGATFIYAVGGLAILAGLTMFDFQRLRRTDDIRTAPLLAASIFLDLLNVFQLFLLLFSRGE